MSISFLFVGLLFGVGFGFFVQKAGLCFSHGLAEVYVGRPKRISRLFLTIFIITSLGFMLSGLYDPTLGLKAIGQLRGLGFYNVLSGMFFGAGILLSGGCILGTLRQLGEGNLSFLVVLLSFVPGMALVVYGINPLLKESYQVQNPLLPDVMAGIPPYVLTPVLALLAVVWLWQVNKK